MIPPSSSEVVWYHSPERGARRPLMQSITLLPLHVSTVWLWKRLWSKDAMYDLLLREECTMGWWALSDSRGIVKNK